MNKLTAIALALVLATITLFLITIPPLSEAQAGKRQPIITLSSSEQVFAETFNIKDVAVHLSNNTELFYILRGNGQVDIYDSHHKLKRTIPTYMKSPVSIAVDSEGGIYIAGRGENQIKIFSSEGKLIKTFLTHQPNSIAVLTNRNIVVACPLNGSLLHIYDSSGRELISFGKVKKFDTSSETQNNFLNRGKVLVDLSDTIYYVYEFAPLQVVQRFSQKGKLLSEFTVTGDAIDLQKEVSAEFLRKRSPDTIGGIRIINSVAIDPTTNHLWIGMNGSSDSGVVYEYKPNGKKLKEYKFLVDSPSYPTKTIISMTQLFVRSPSIYLFTFNGAFRIDINGGTSIVAPPFYTQATCPPTVTFNDCTTPCGTEDTNNDKYCKTELLASVNMQGRRIIEVVCNIDATSCTAQIKLCKESDGVQTTHNISSNCSNGGGTACAIGTPCIDEVACLGCDANCECTGYNPYSPILIDINGDGFALTNLSGGVWFDLDVRGRRGHTPWTAANTDDAFLVLDRNGNGAIDDGTELFGNMTPQPLSLEQNGFIALAEYDKPINGGNGDGEISSSDAIYTSLWLWRDSNHNGISEANELHTLQSLGVASIDLGYKESKRTDEYSNQFRYRAKVRDARGHQVGRWAWDVFFNPLH
jgi:hypothetical protein